MMLDFGLIKKHPYAVGGTILVIGGIVFYYIAIKGSGSSSAGSSAGDLAGSTQEFLNAQTAQVIAANQANVPVEIASIQAQSNNLAITKQAESYQAYIDAQKTVALGTVQAQTSSAVDLATIESELQQANLSANAAQNAELIKLVGQHYPGSSTGVVQIISALQGQGPAALAYTNPGAYSGGGVSISIPGVGSFGAHA